MHEVVRFLGRDEREAFVSDVLRDLNRARRKAAVKAGPPLNDGAVASWAEERPDVVSAVGAPLATRAQAAGLLGDHGDWLRCPSHEEFLAWVREISDEIGEERPRVALAIAASVVSGSCHVDELEEVVGKGDEGGREAPPEGTAPVLPGREQVDGGASEELRLRTCLALLRERPPQWEGWEQMAALANELLNLATARIEERAAVSSFATALANVAEHAADLEYLELTTWSTWAERSQRAYPSPALLLALDKLAVCLVSLNEIRSSGPRTHREERLYRERQDDVVEQIEALFDEVEGGLGAAGPDTLHVTAAERVDEPARPVRTEGSEALADSRSDENAESTSDSAESRGPPGRDHAAPQSCPPSTPDAPDRGRARRQPDDACPEPAEALKPPRPEPASTFVEVSVPQDAAMPRLAAERDAVPTDVERALTTPHIPVLDSPSAPKQEQKEPEALVVPRPERRSTRPPPVAPPQSTSVAVPPVSSVPAELASFDGFADAFTVGTDLRVHPAPWKRDDFASRALTAFESELAKRPPAFQRMWILAKGASRFSALPAAEDVEELAGWWHSGYSRRHDPSRGPAMIEACIDGSMGPTTRWRIAVLLEALSSSPVPLDAGVAEEMVHHLGLEDHGLEVALVEILNLRSRVAEPVVWLRGLLEPAEGVPLATAERRLASRRQDLFDYFRSVSQAGGGKIQQTHCREAWRDFIESLLPDLRHLFPVEHGGDAQWAAAQRRSFIDGIEGLHADIADRRGARLKDRVRMDRLAERIASHAQATSEAMEAVEEARQRKAGRVGDVAVRVDVFRNLAEGPPTAGVVGFLREVLVRTLFPPPAVDDVDPLGIVEDDLRRHPDLLEFLPAVAGSATSPEYPSVSDIADLQAAAGVILEAEQSLAAHGLPEVLRERGREDLLGRVVVLCSEEDRVRIHAEQDAALEAARRSLAELEWARLRLADAASPLHVPIWTINRQAVSALDDQPPRLRLFTAWIGELTVFAREELQRAAKALLDEARPQGEAVLAQVGDLVRESRFAEALTVLHGRVVHTAAGLRHTEGRRAAATAFPEPARRLAAADVSPPVPRWLAPAGDHSQERALLTEFAKLVLDDLYPKERDQGAISVRCDEVRARIDKRQLNPCYVPQLQRFGHITIPKVPVRPTDPQFPLRAADAAGHHPNDLVILLAPRITKERRDAVLHELRRRSATAAVIDDLDVCRLLNPGGTRPDPVMGLLEIALEQQRWTAVSPFGAVEGQHVQLEMYVGRREEARDLAHTSRYSRLFSGRKLGKSALLRYVEQRHDRQLLPSGKELRVLYVSAVGIETDVALVDQIITCLANRCGARPEQAPREAETPTSRLERVLAGHIAHAANESLLIVLDEADAFVEAELERYQQRAHESCLSWVMSRRIEAERDSQGLARVRFVFTGYRVTNTRDGVWFNWSDVLRLVPLPPDDAAELIAAPLARLGIDASDQAAMIAHRCGYQPAVLLRFGERLLSRLEQQHPPAVREQRSVSVTADDVAATFEEDAIQDEVRRVTSNNFRDNDVGAIIFGALLSLFLGMGPAATMDAAEDRLIARLRELDGGDFRWMAEEGGNLHEQIKSKLRDLVARQLLVERRLLGEGFGYALRFPHHLSVLAPLAREERIRDAIKRIRAGAGPMVQHTARGLLTRADHEVVQRLITTRPDPKMVIAPVVGHLWSLTAEQAIPLLLRGLFDPLGLDRGQVYDAGNPVAQAVPSDPSGFAFRGVRAERIDALVTRCLETKKVPLLVGGVDLLRSALSGSARGPEPGVHLQAMGFGRLLRSHIGWWFERARGFNFAQADAIERIAAATSGIPLLVGFVDRDLKRHDPDGGGLEVTAELLASVLDGLAGHLGRAAALLVRGTPETTLTSRELELAQMLAQAARSNGSNGATWEDLSVDLWPEHALSLPPGSALAAAAPVAPERLLEDQIALQVLQQVGLVPARPEVSPGLVLDRLGPVQQTDALVSLMDHLPSP